MQELEKKAAGLAKKSDMEIAEDARKRAIREMADKQIDLAHDAVKLLSSMGQRAIAFTIRDQQLEEKHRLAAIERQLDQRTDMMMEVDRLKDIRDREAEESSKRTKRITDRSVINEQIAQRQRDRMLQLEAREQENIAMRNLMKSYEDEDRTNAARRAKDIEKSRAEVIRANEEAIARKQQARQAEKKEMEDILIYQAMKDAEFAKREEEERAVERSKKERQAKLLAEQEKAANNAGKLDELRARRAAEEKERQERAKERSDALARKAAMEELLSSRAVQAEDKRRRAAMLKDMEKGEVQAGLEYTQKMDAREAAEAKAKADKVATFRITLQKQIAEIERLREAQRLGGAGAGNIREELIREEERLRVIRDQLAANLESQGVNPKYLSEMKNTDVGKILRR